MKPYWPMENLPGRPVLRGHRTRQSCSFRSLCPDGPAPPSREREPRGAEPGSVRPATFRALQVGREQSMRLRFENSETPSMKLKMLSVIVGQAAILDTLTQIQAIVPVNHGLMMRSHTVAKPSVSSIAPKLFSSVTVPAVGRKAKSVPTVISAPPAGVT